MSDVIQNDQTLEMLAANALSAGRAAVPVLRDVIAQNMFGMVQQQARAIADSIERRDIFKSCVVWDLNDLLEQIDREVEDMIVRVDLWPDDPCDMTGNGWTETLWTPEALELAAARSELRSLCEAIETVLDYQAMPRLLAPRKGNANPAQTLHP